MAAKYRVVQVKGSTPEVFIVVGIDFAKSSITSTSEAMPESKMREHLRAGGASATDIDAWITQARKYPSST